MLQRVLHAAVFVGQHGDIALLLLVAQWKVAVATHVVGTLEELLPFALAESVGVAHHVLHLALVALASALGRVAVVNGGVETVEGVVPSGLRHLLCFLFFLLLRCDDDIVIDLCVPIAASDYAAAYPSFAN